MRNYKIRHQSGRLIPLDQVIGAIITMISDDSTHQSDVDIMFNGVVNELQRKGYIDIAGEQMKSYRKCGYCGEKIGTVEGCEETTGICAKCELLLGDI